jgi:hypothetical protein
MYSTRKSPWVVLVCLIVFLVVGCANTQNSKSSDSKKQYFDTPEAAIKFFVKNIAEENAEAALLAFPIDEDMRKFQFTKYSKLYTLIRPKENLAPSEYEFFLNTNKWESTGKNAKELRAFMYGFLGVESVEDYITVSKESDAFQFIDQVNPKLLKELKIVEIAPMGDSNKIAKKTWTEEAQVFGATQLVERAVLYEISGINYYGGFRLLKYENSWRIFTVYPILTGFQFKKFPIARTTPDQFQNEIKPLGK